MATSVRAGNRLARSRPAARALLVCLGLAVVRCGDDEQNEPPRDIVGEPVAVALVNPTAGVEGQSVQLDGSTSSDSAGESLSFAWNQGSGPTAIIEQPDSSRTNVILPEVSENRPVSFELTVTNRSGITDTDRVFITILNAGVPPSADAGPDVPIRSGQSTELDASASSDPDGNLVNFFWEVTVGPSIDFDNPSAARVSFVAPDVTAPSVALVRLTVTDDSGLSASATTRITIEPSPMRLAFVDAPDSLLRNTPFAPLAVEVQNASGQRIVDGTGSRTVLTLSDSNNGELVGDTELTAVNGLVSLDALRYSQVEESFQLQANADGLDAAIFNTSVVWPSPFPTDLGSDFEIVRVLSIGDGDTLVFGTASGEVDLDLSGEQPAMISADEGDLVWVRYTSTGNVRWQKHISAGGLQRAVAAELTQDGDVLIAFELRGSVELPTPTPIALSAEGTPSVGFARLDTATGEAEGAGTLQGDATAVVTDLERAGTDDIVLVGWFDGTLDVDPGIGADIRTSTDEDGFVIRLNSVALIDSGDGVLSFARTPALEGDDRFNAVAVSSGDVITTVGSQGGGERVWVLGSEADGAAASDIAFGGDSGPSAALDVRARGNSVQVVGFVGGASDFAGDTVQPGAGGEDGFFAVYSNQGDLAFVRTVAGSGDERVHSLVETDAFDASFVLAGEFEGFTTFDFGVSREVRAPSSAGPATFVLSLGFDGAIRWLEEWGPTVGTRNARIASQSDNTVWLWGNTIEAGPIDADLFGTEVPLTTATDELIVVRFDPARALVIP